MDSELGGTNFLRALAFGRLFGGQSGAMKAPDGPGEAPEGRRGGCKMLFFHCFFFIVISRLPCILSFGSCFCRLAALISCEHVLLEDCLGARRGSMRAPDGPGEAPAGRPGGV